MWDNWPFIFRDPVVSPKLNASFAASHKMLFATLKALSICFSWIEKIQNRGSGKSIRIAVAWNQIVLSNSLIGLGLTCRRDEPAKEDTFERATS
jgi:hypothetical protein